MKHTHIHPINLTLTLKKGYRRQSSSSLRVRWRAIRTQHSYVIPDDGDDDDDDVDGGDGGDGVFFPPI